MKYEEARQLFENYVKDFDMNNEKVKYKYDHSYRVADYSLEIAKSLNLSEDEIELAHSCGMLHDIGRFVQVTKYNTYHDVDSLDHGDQGYLVLKELGVTNNVVLESTKYHNKREVSDELTDEEKFFTNITRDADKIDILFMCNQGVPEDKLTLTDDIVNYFRSHSLTLDKTSDHTEAMHALRCVSFVFDINFDYSFKIIKDNNLITDKLNNLLKICDDPRLLEIRDIVLNYIDERVK